MTHKQEEHRWFLNELLEQFSRDRDFATIRDILHFLCDSERTNVLNELFGIALVARDWKLAECCVAEGVAIPPSPENPGDSGPIWMVLEQLGDAPDVLEWLIQHGADVEQRGVSYATPLIGAASYGHQDCVAMLIKHGGNINASTQIDDCDTPLISAAINGHLRVVKMLIENGADVEKRDLYGLTAAQRAKQLGHHEIAAYIQQSEKKR